MNLSDENSPSAADEKFGGQAPIVLLGVPLHWIVPSRYAQLGVLIVVFMVSSTSFAALQERVLYVPGFRFTGWLSQITSLTYVCCGLAERCASSQTARTAPLHEYVKLSILTMGGMYFTNWSLRYLSYPLRVVFKSSKLLPVMLLSMCYIGKTYTLKHFLAMGLLVSGLVLFTVGDAKGKASFDIRGVVIIIFGSLLEAFAATFEEKRLFGKLKCNVSEVVLYYSCFGFLWAVGADLIRGDVFPAVSHSKNHPETILYISSAAVAGYVAQSVQLNIIKHFSSTMGEIVRSCRKILTVLISFVWFGKPWTLFHVAGCLLFVSSVAAERFFEGGKSRRFAGGLMGLASLAAVALVSSGGPPVFRVIIDAGSMGTRLHVFKFDSWTSQLLYVGKDPQVYVEREPGISAFIQNTSGIEPLLKPLVSAAVSRVPFAQRTVTPLALRATAGLLQVSQSASVISDRLLAGARKVLEPYGFADGGISVMDGVAEGLNLWTSVNFLAGTFAPGMQSIQEPFAVVALNSGATQLAYLIAESDAKAAESMTYVRGFVHKIQLPLKSGSAHLYQNRFADFGLMAARGKSFDKLEIDGQHPCLPTDASITWSFGHRTRTAIGAANQEKCRSVAEGILGAKVPCQYVPARQDGFTANVGQSCSFGGVWLGPGIHQWPGQRCLLVSYFYDRLIDARTAAFKGSNIMHITRAEILEEASRVCSMAFAGLHAMSARFPHLSDDSVSWLCFDLTYMAKLVAGLNLDLHTTLHVAGAIRGFRTSWALGVAIDSLAR